MEKTSFRLIAILLILISTASLSQANPTGSGVPTLAELRNATFSGIEEGPVSLSNGRWQGNPYVEGGASRPTAGLIDNVYYTGDLDGDGELEAVVILWRMGGGTGENDAMCCPTMLATRTWSLQGNQLVEGEIEVTGKLSLAALEGTEWVLTHMNRNQAVPETAEVTLGFGDGRIAGKSACNRYSAGIEDGDNAGDIKIGQSISTMMACPGELMRIEREYLDALLQVTSFSFHTGSLALNGQKNDGTPFNMLFSRAEKDIPEGTSN